MRKLSLVVLLALSTAAAAQEKKKESAHLGVRVAPIVEETRAAYKIPESVTAGVVLAHVEKGSAAEKAGLRAGDVLVWFDGKAVTEIDALVAAVRSHEPGDKVTYRVMRGTGSIEGTLALGRRTDGAEVIEIPVPRSPDRRREPETDLDKRLDRVAEQIEELRKRAEKDAGAKRADRPGKAGKTDKRAAPRRGLEGWIHREELRLEAARKRGDERAIHFHEIRLDLLREMAKAGFAAGGAEQRLVRIERKLDAILAMLRPPRKAKGQAKAKAEKK